MYATGFNCNLSLSMSFSILRSLTTNLENRKNLSMYWLEKYNENMPILKHMLETGTHFGTTEPLDSSMYLLDTYNGDVIFLPEALGCHRDDVEAELDYVHGNEVEIYYHREWYTRCNECGEWFTDGGYGYGDLHFCCITCAEEHGLFRCEHCDELASYDYSYRVYDEDGYSSEWCENCAEYDAHYCEECDRYVEDDAWDYDNDMCLSCSSSRHNDDYHDALHCYSYDPMWHTFGDTQNNMYPTLGIENETDTNNWGTRHDYIEDLLHVRAANRIFFTEDGSLDNGVEVTSHPMTLDEHISCGVWEDVAKVAKEHRFTSHDNGRCGLHIHINIDFFSKNPDIQAVASYKLVTLARRFRTQFIKFSRRTSDYWCKFDYSNMSENILPKKVSVHTTDTSSRTLVYRSKLVKENNRGHNMIWNFQHGNTIECRLFRGTLNIETLYASMLFVQGLARFVKTHGEAKCETISWYDLMTWIIADAENETARDAFVKYLNRRGLYLAETEDAE